MLQYKGYPNIDQSIDDSLDDDNDINRNIDAYNNHHYHIIAYKNYDKTITMIQSTLQHSAVARPILKQEEGGGEHQQQE
jgi:hypothetical protein